MMEIDDMGGRRGGLGSMRNRLISFPNICTSRISVAGN